MKMFPCPNPLNWFINLWSIIVVFVCCRLYIWIWCNSCINYAIAKLHTLLLGILKQMQNDPLVLSMLLDSNYVPVLVVHMFYICFLCKNIIIKTLKNKVWNRIECIIIILGPCLFAYLTACWIRQKRVLNSLAGFGGCLLHCSDVSAPDSEDVSLLGDACILFIMISTVESIIGYQTVLCEFSGMCLY